MTSKRYTSREDIRVAELRVQLRAAVQAVCAAKELLDQLEGTELSPADRTTREARAPASGDTAHPTSAGRLIPVTDWPKFHPWPKVSGLRHLIFNASQNGFDRVIRKVGDRVLIHETSFFEWVESGHQSGHGRDVPKPTKRSRARKLQK